MHKDLLIIRKLIKEFNLDLSGLNIYTECATGSYEFSPIIPILAGADNVYAEAKDTNYSSAENAIVNCKKIASKLIDTSKITFLKKRSHIHLSNADIITNTNNVRPIDKDLINNLKQTSVIPLMWETWEIRKSDFCLDYCKKKGILVLGTKEEHAKCNMNLPIALNALKLLFKLNYDGGEILLIGSNKLPLKSIINYFKKLDIPYTWSGPEDYASINYIDLRSHLLKEGEKYSHIFIAEHFDSRLLIGKNGLIEAEEIKLINKEIRIGIMCGNIDSRELEKFSIKFEPKKINPFGFMSYNLYELGSLPILRLYIASLKVGEIMARYRLNGLSCEESALKTLEFGFPMDFSGSDAWAKRYN